MYRLNPVQHTPLSGIAEQKTHHATISYQSGGKSRTFKFNKITTTIFGCIAALLVVSVMSAGSYLYLRDDLVSATLARQIKMQYAYEDRIAALRSQVDIVTSRQLLDQQAVENRMSQLMTRQIELTERDRQVSKIFSRTSGMDTTGKQAINTGANKKSLKWHQQSILNRFYRE